MPKLGGVEATQAIRAWEDQHGLSRTPILAITANVMTQQVGAYLAAGMDRVIAKPIDPRQLIDSVRSILPLAQAA